MGESYDGRAAVPSISREGVTQKSCRVTATQRIIKVTEQSVCFGRGGVTAFTERRVTGVYFLHVYSSLFDKACPIKYIRATSKYIKREPWITGGMMISIINKSKLYRKKINKPNEQNLNNYKLYSNIFNKLKKTAKAKYYTDMLDIHKHSIKETWAVLRQVMNKNKQSVKLPKLCLL